MIPIVAEIIKDVVVAAGTTAGAEVAGAAVKKGMEFVQDKLEERKSANHNLDAKSQNLDEPVEISRDRGIAKEHDFDEPVEISRDRGIAKEHDFDEPVEISRDRGIAKEHDFDEPVEISRDRGIAKEHDFDEQVEISPNRDTDSTTVEQEHLFRDGGSYNDVKKHSNGETHEVHHMPADTVSPLERDDGPAIKMEKADHRQTASCGSSLEAREYRAHQKELIDSGDFRGAVNMDIEDIRSKFGDKYDNAISQMNSYIDELKEGGKI